MATSVGEIRAKLVLSNDEFKRKMSEARDDMKKTGFSATQMKKDFDAVQKASLVLGTAIVGALGSSVKVAADFQQGMARVQAVSGATEDEFRNLEKAARDAGATTVFSATDGANALSYLAMAGFDVNQQVAALPAVLNAAAAGQIDLARSADIVSNIMTGFGISADDTGRAVDVLVKTMTTANTDLPMLGDAMKYVAPVASSLGLSIEETATAVAKMSDAGIQGSQAGTALRQMLLSLANPTGQTVDAMEELNIKVTDANGKMKPLPELIGHIAERFKGMTDAQMTATSAQLVGTEAASGFVTLLKNGENGLKEYTKELENSGGTAQRIAEIQNDTLIGSFKEFQSIVEELGIKLGNEFLPVFRDIVNWGADIVRVITELDTSTLKSSIAFAGTAAAIALTASTVGKLVLAVRGLFVSMGPAGWLIAGLSLVGGLIVANNTAQEEAVEVNLDHARSLEEQSKSLESQIDRYEELREKNKLTNTELSRFVDLQTLLATETDPQKIEEMQKQYDELMKNSGLTNEEMAEFLGLNDSLIEKVPNSNLLLSEQGNILLENTDAARAYNEQLQKELEIELRKQANNASEALKQNIQDRTDALAEQNKLAEEYLGIQEEIEVQKMRIAAEEVRHAIAMESGDKASIALAEEALKQEESKLERLRDQEISLSGQIIEQEEIINNAELQILKGQEAYHELINYRLELEGVTAEKGKEVEAIQKALDETKKLRRETVEKFNEDKKITAEEQEQLDKLSEKITRLSATKSEVEKLVGEQNNLTNAIDTSVGVAKDLTYEMDKDVEKWVYQKGFSQSDAEAMNNALQRTITKNVTVRYSQVGNPGPSGTSNRMLYHTGGIVEEPPKLHTGGTAASIVEQMRNAPMHNEVDVRLLQNEMVLTEAQQANLFRIIGSGQSASGNDFTDEKIDQLIALLSRVVERPIQVTSELNGDVLLNELYEPFKEREAVDDATGRYME